jgi:hypothetical protein
MPSRCREFVDSRLRRSPPDRASAVPYGQAGENAMRFPHLAHRSAAAHKLHSTPQQDGMNLISGNDETSSRLPALAYSSPEAVQTTGTVALTSEQGRPVYLLSAGWSDAISLRADRDRNPYVRDLSAVKLATLLSHFGLSDAEAGVGLCSQTERIAVVLLFSFVIVGSERVPARS